MSAELVKPHESHSAVVRVRSRHRSAITNGSELLPGVSGNSTWARRLRDLCELHGTDLGGLDELSEAQRALIRRASALTVELERLEARFATRDATADELDLYSRLSNTLRRLHETLGIQRRARPIKTLREHLESAP
jgi:hypothetical protein